VVFLKFGRDPAEHLARARDSAGGAQADLAGAAPHECGSVAVERRVCAGAP
jgi:hypothetical protein